MRDSRLYLELGYSSVFQYAERCFGYGKSETYEQLRVAATLEELPLLREAFEAGAIPWSALKEITRVATRETEAEWLRFFRARGSAELKLEVSDALEKGRKSPRKNGAGLPRLKVKVAFEYLPEEHAVLEKALEKVAGEVQKSLGGEVLKPHEALLYLAQRVLETDGSAGGREETESSPFTILYHVCPQCRQAKLATEAGFVEVPQDVVERIEGEAERVVIPPEEELFPAEAEAEDDIDRPNAPALTRRVLLRGRGVCANRACGNRLGLQSHHLVFRSAGGRTVLSNSIPLCGSCHATVHAGFLKIEGNPLEGLVWKTQVEEDRFDLEGIPRPRRERDPPLLRRQPEVCGVGRLRKLGYSSREARQRVTKALEGLEATGDELSEEKVLKAALRSR